MIEIGINPNTKIPSVAIRLNGYFGIGKDGVKLVDSDTIFQSNTIQLAGVLPITAFDTLQTEGELSGEDQVRDKKTGQFMKGRSGNPAGRPVGIPSKNPVTELLKEVLETKHYKIKDTGEMVVAKEIVAEKWVDRVVERLDPRLLEMMMDRTEGRVTQGVRISGALSHGVIPEKDLEKLKEIFPDVE